MPVVTELARVFRSLFAMRDHDVSKRFFIFLVLGCPLRLPGRTIARNELWGDFVPLVKATSRRLTALQDFMVAHQSEGVLTTLDSNALTNLDCLISELDLMQRKLRQLRWILISGRK